MSRHTCTSCKSPIPTGQAKLAGNGRTVTAWHRDCYILDGIETATLRMTVEAHIRPLRDAS